MYTTTIACVHHKKSEGYIQQIGLRKKNIFSIKLVSIRNFLRVSCSVFVRSSFLDEFQWFLLTALTQWPKWVVWKWREWKDWKCKKAKKFTLRGCSGSPLELRVVEGGRRRGGGWNMNMGEYKRRRRRDWHVTAQPAIRRESNGKRHDFAAAILFLYLPLFFFSQRDIRYEWHSTIYVHVHKFFFGQ